jgi:hypothetical protein
VSHAGSLGEPPARGENQTSKSFCFFFQKEVLFFFEKKNQKTFARLDTL